MSDAAVATAATSGAVFLAFLDVTVVNLAFPDLRAEFPDASLTDVSWVITAYAVTFAAFLAPSGRVADVLGRRRVFLFGVLAFTLASVAAAAAPSLGLLVAARAIQGAAAAAMIPSSLSLILANTPPARHAKAIALWSAAGALAAAVGPTVGGVLVEVSGWRAVFLINVPVGAAILAVARRVPGAGPRSGRLPDPVGTAALAGGVGLVVLAVSQGLDWGWTDPRTLASAAVGAAGLALALGRSRRHAAPALEVSLWRDRRYAATNAVSVLYGAGLFSFMLLGVIFLVQAWDYGELKAGLALSPAPVGAAVAALLGAKLVDRYGYRAVAAAGSVLMGGICMVLYFALPADPAFLTVWLPTALVGGAATGLTTVALSGSAASSVPPQHFAAGLGLNMTARQFGGALGVAGLAAFLQWRAADPFEALLQAYALCGVVSLAAGAVAAGMPGRPRVAPPADAPLPEQAAEGSDRQPAA